MGKKKAQGGSKHQSQSFEQLVGAANRNALKPFIIETAVELVNDLGNQLAQRLFGQLGNIQTRIMALEKVLQQKFGLSEADIQNIVMDVEDEATGHTKVDRPAQAGDLLRVSAATKAKDQTEYNPSVRKEVNSLGAAKPTLTKVVDEALVGMSSGETKEVTIGDGAMTVRVTVDRVSAPPAAAPTEG